MKKELTDGSIEQITALAVAGDFSLEALFGQGLHNIGDDVWADMEDIDDMEGMKPRLPQIGIIHKSELFKMPDGSKVEKITGWLVDNNPCGAWWEIPYEESGGNTPPDCYSLDGIKPADGCLNKQAELCAVCEKHHFGPNNERPECSSNRRLHLIIPGSALPHRLTLPPSSLKAFKEFTVKEVTGRRLKYLVILVELSLTPATSKAGIDYSEIMMNVVKDSSGKPVILAKNKEQVHALKQFRDEWLEAMRGQEILAEEQHVKEVFEDNGINAPGDAFDVSQYSAPIPVNENDRQGNIF